MDIDQAIQALPKDVQNIILEYVLDDLQYIDIQIQLGWIRRLRIDDGLETELSRVLKKPEEVYMYDGVSTYKRRLDQSCWLELHQSHYYVFDQKHTYNDWRVFNRKWWSSLDHEQWERYTVQGTLGAARQLCTTIQNLLH